MTNAERIALLDEIAMLRAEVRDLQADLLQIRGSAWFRLRAKLVPGDSLLQRIYYALRTGSSLKPAQLGQIDYPTWCELKDTLTDADREAIRLDVQAMTAPPVISIVVPVYNAPAPLLEQALSSVQKQLYPHWELCLVDDASTQPHIKPLLEKWASEDKRIKTSFRTENGHISASTNDGLTMVTGDYVAFMDQDDFLPEHALYTVAKYLERNPDAAFLYSDEDRTDAGGKRAYPQFKPDWDPFLFLACNYCCHLSVFRADLAKSVGLRVGFEGAQDWDFILRFIELIEPKQIVHIPHVLYHWRAHSGSTAQDIDAKPYAAKAQMKAVGEALERKGEATSPPRIDAWGLVRFSFRVPTPHPLVSVIIPTRNRETYLEKCVSSLFDVTEYDPFEVLIIDNGSDEPAALQLIAELGKDPRVKVLTEDSPFNYSSLNNLAARQANGRVLALLNNDIEIVDPTWMYRMTSYAVRADVGAVGARLLYPDRRVQHGGVIIGHGGVAGHAHLGIKGTDPGYSRWALIDRTVSAVTAACLFVRKEVYDKVGGFDEQFAVSFNDIDLCLRIGDLGLRNVYAGSVTCIHHESATRGLPEGEKQEQFNREILLFRSRWRDRLECDPYYNPNLTLERDTFTPSDRPRAPYPWQALERT